MKISISGASAQGKTTLINRLARDSFLAEHNFQFTQSPARLAKNEGYEVNDIGGDETQILIMARHIENLHRKGNWIFDRSIIDSYAYAYANWIDPHTASISNGVYEANSNLLEKMMSKYDICFYIKPELPVVFDGVRNMDEVYFKRTLSGFKDAIDFEGHQTKIVQIGGTVEERYNTVISHIKQLFV